MTAALFQDHYRITSSRAFWHDYNGGIYFITICTKGRKHYFGKITTADNSGRDGACPASKYLTCPVTKITEPAMVLSAIGHYANEQFCDVNNHYPYAEIPLWVVMPNHIHCIVLIDAKKVPYNRRIVETGRAPSPDVLRAPSPDVLPAPSAIMQKTDDMKGWLSVAIGGLKSSITKFAHENGIPFAWQPRFHDRIIRNPDEMNRIANYIEQNVSKWAFDEFNGV